MRIEKECPTCYKLIYNQKEFKQDGCPDNSCPSHSPVYVRRAVALYERLLDIAEMVTCLECIAPDSCLHCDAKKIIKQRGNNMKRQKKVFKSVEVAHIWAQQKQEEGQNAQGNIFFQGKSIYSYGLHFEMARFIKPDVVLRTTRRYSVTTAKHLSYVWRALSDNQKMFDVPTFDDHSENGHYLAKEIRETIDKLNRSRTFISGRLDRISGATNKAREYLGLFKKEMTITARNEIRKLDKYFHKVLTQDRIDLLKSREVENKKRANVRYEEQRRLNALEAGERLEKWKTGELNYLNAGDSPIALRIKGDNIETSHGATVPLLAARELWDKLQRREPLHGMTLGEYTVQGLADGILTVGCHKIPLMEVLRMAKNLNWQEVA